MMIANAYVTVAELIQALQKYPNEMRVKIASRDFVAPDEYDNLKVWPIDHVDTDGPHHLGECVVIWHTIDDTQ